MEQLAASAAKAFASLGGLLSGVAKGGWSVGQAIASKVDLSPPVITHPYIYMDLISDHGHI